MKLTEIVKVVQQHSSGISQEVLQMKNAALIGTVENIPMYKKEFPGNIDVFALKLDGIFVCWLVGVWGNILGKQMFCIKRTYVLPKYRNRGLITSMYYTLYQKFHISLVSDVEQSPETISVWKKLSNILNVQAYDTLNKKAITTQDVGDALYGTERYVLMLESLASNFPSMSEGILQDYIIFTDIRRYGACT